VTAVLARAAILLAALTVACLLLAGCAGAGAPRARASSPATAPAAATSGGSVFGRVLGNPSVAVTGGRLYVTWQVSQASARVPRFELARADQATGAIEAARRLGAGHPGTPLAAGGWLWVTISADAGERLLRMNPADLAVTGVAGGLAWVTEQVSSRHDYCADPVTGRALGRIPLPDPARDYVSAIAGRYVYYLAPAPGGAGFYLRRLGVPASCHAPVVTG
jgi:hypothetical protein